MNGSVGLTTSQYISLTAAVINNIYLYYGFLFNAGHFCGCSSEIYCFVDIKYLEYSRMGKNLMKSFIEIDSLI